MTKLITTYGGIPLIVNNNLPDGLVLLSDGPIQLTPIKDYYQEMKDRQKAAKDAFEGFDIEYVLSQKRQALLQHVQSNLDATKQLFTHRDTPLNNEPYIKPAVEELNDGWYDLYKIGEDVLDIITWFVPNKEAFTDVEIQYDGTKDDYFTALTQDKESAMWFKLKWG